MPELIDIERLPKDLAAEVRKAERQRLLHEDAHLSYHEAAEVYGYPYQTIRTWVTEKRLTPVRVEGERPYLTHAEMRRYVKNKLKVGAPRHAEMNEEVGSGSRQAAVNAPHRLPTATATAH